MKRLLLATVIGLGTLGAASAQTTTTTTITTIEQPQVDAIRTYVTRQPAPTVTVPAGTVVTVGETLPEPVPLYRVPSDVVSGTSYQYTVVDGQTYLVDENRTVIQVID